MDPSFADSVLGYLTAQMTNEQTRKRYFYCIRSFLDSYYAGYTAAQFGEVTDDDLVGAATEFINSDLRSWDRKYALRKLLAMYNRMTLYYLLPQPVQPARRELNKEIPFGDIQTIISVLEEPYRCIFIAQYTTGSRISAILKYLRVQDIVYDEEVQLYKIVMHEKREQIRTCYIDDFAAQELIEYIRRSGARKGLVFPGVYYEKALYHLHKAAVQVLGRTIGTHAFRHSRIMHLKAKGYSPEKVKLYTGHRNWDSFMRYWNSSGSATLEFAKGKGAPHWMDED
jgi:integrase